MKDARKVKESKPDVREFKSIDGEDYEPFKCKCKYIRKWPLSIGAFQDQCKQTVINKRNMVKTTQGNVWKLEENNLKRRGKEIKETLKAAEALSDEEVNFCARNILAFEEAAKSLHIVRLT